MRHSSFNALLGITLVASLVSPGLASAATVGAGLNVGGSVSGTVRTTVNFCTALSAFSTTVNERLTAATNRLDARQQWIETTASDRKSEHAQALSDLRARQDQDRLAVYAKLSAKATTAPQKTAELQFQASMDAAMTVRRAAVDAAVDAYWTGVMNVLTARKAATVKAEQDLAAALKTSLASATSACASGMAPATVRLDFATSVKADLSAFATERMNIEKAGPQIKALVQTRNAAVLKATSDFKLSAEKADADLKAAWSASASS